ncbi:hypothetical protein ACFS5N_00630 [Mucilaginibacter ximonensis]|uniref:Tetratricopeptide repeat protein n=1 Tax=Mucilaginibacter ximonensis TaxID=538021 RepID=A0ABW5Y6U8_9SPHI
MMFKRIFLLVITLFITAFAFAQTKADTVYGKYADFNLLRLDGKTPDAIKLGEIILPDVNELPVNSRISFYNGLAKLYEDDDESKEAILLYEKVVAAQPDFYVAHRALGYLFLKHTDELYDKMQANPGDTVMILQYKAAVQKALPHLEKAQACDPSDETLEIIKRLYTNIHDYAGLQSLNGRLAGMAKNCIDILKD